MTDTSPEIAELVRQKLMARSGDQGIVTFDDASRAPAGFAELAPAW